MFVSLLKRIDCIWWRNPSKTTEEPKSIIRSQPLLTPPEGQRCSGRYYKGRRCCTPENPCDEGEGDCDGPDDGGGHDGHEGCKGDLVCGSSNCKKFGIYFHELDDCCEQPLNPFKEAQYELIKPGLPLEPKVGQRCSGRNYDDPGRRCCTPEDPCNEGEGDCDGPNEGGQNDGHLGCKGNLVCGTNNCIRFGAFYHKKDDCCEMPALPLQNQLNNTNNKSLDVKSLDEFAINLLRCRGSNFDNGRCCTRGKPCIEGEGDCQADKDCRGNLVCGNSNCKDFGSFFNEQDNCCIKASSNTSSFPKILNKNVPLTEPYPGQRCSGRNQQGRRCCTPENPCDEGEGDCDGPDDGGGHDGHEGCRDDLVCGSNNCKKFGSFYHEKDDCCEQPSYSTAKQPEAVLYPGALLKPKQGQRCSGRNYQDRRCCTPENPCDEGEGDCDGPDDGGQHDGHEGCKGDLLCGSNNCNKFGAYFHEKDDCCEKPKEVWGEWEAWSPCSKSCDVGRWGRERHCKGATCNHKHQAQQRFCNTQPCFPWGRPRL